MTLPRGTFVILAAALGLLPDVASARGEAGRGAPAQSTARPSSLNSPPGEWAGPEDCAPASGTLAAPLMPRRFDRLVVVDGPQRVLVRPGTFEVSLPFARDPKRSDTERARGYGCVEAGSFGRHDERIDARAGSPEWEVRGVGARSASDDYSDGDGDPVHSAYTRWLGGGGMAWTPDERSRIELAGSAGDEQAAYADRSVDSARYRRNTVGLQLQREDLSPWVEKIAATVYRHYADQVMDSAGGNGPGSAGGGARGKSVDNTDRNVRGARLIATLRPSRSHRVAVGFDGQADDHTVRATGNQGLSPYEGKPREQDGEFSVLGAFGQWTRDFGGDDRFIAGVRADRWRATDLREKIALGKGPKPTHVPNPTAGLARTETLWSGFGRVERTGGKGATLYAALGSAERFPDYWEVFADREGPDSVSAFTTRPERTTQLEAGWDYRAGPWDATLAAFAGRIDDFILIQAGVPREDPARAAVIARNVEARRWGMEAAASHSFESGWKAEVSLGWVRGENGTDGRPLAQQPPFEARFALERRTQAGSMGAHLRAAARQDRIDPGAGNLYGQDVGPTPGFAVVSVFAGWRPAKGWLVSAGIDNLLDKAYAQHISRSGAMVPGYVQTTRVNEPGRALWAKVILETAVLAKLAQ